MRKYILSLIFAIASVSVWATPQSVTLDLPTTNCALCPITVKKALTRVEGVIKVQVSYEDKQAVVTFEDTQASAEKFVEATTNAGYPATVVTLEQP